MKSYRTNNSIIFIRTDNETKEEFRKAAKKVCMTANTLGELLIKQGTKKINKKYEKQKVQKSPVIK
jgi:antitoxin component of RelBE/YafQ-DinJ toxin-antitoxin module